MSSKSPRRDDSELTYQDVLDYMSTRDWPVTSKSIAAEFGISQQAAYYRLQRLRDRGDIERQKLGRNVVLWRLNG
jgi:predicted ArsR family transcriptional regulator